MKKEWLEEELKRIPLRKNEFRYACRSNLMDCPASAYYHIMPRLREAINENESYFEFAKTIDLQSSVLLVTANNTGVYIFDQYESFIKKKLGIKNEKSSELKSEREYKNNFSSDDVEYRYFGLSRTQSYSRNDNDHADYSEVKGTREYKDKYPSGEW